MEHMFELYICQEWAHTFNSRTQEKEAGRSLWIRGHSWLRNEFQASQVYTTKNVSLKKQNKIQQE